MLLLFVAALGSEPPQPHIDAGFDTYNIFWPNDTDANGTAYPCAYLPTLVLANNTRLIAHTNCVHEDHAADCNGFHAPRPASGGDNRLGLGAGANPNAEGLICQKHSDDGGRTWSKLRLALRGAQTGQVVWDAQRGVLLMHTTNTPPLPRGLSEWRSTDLGDTWQGPRDLGFIRDKGPPGDGSHTIWASPGAALQLSQGNRFHPGRLIFTGHINSCQSFWHTDDGGATYALARNGTSLEAPPFCPDVGIGETAMAETPLGGVTTSSRNGAFHGPGKCDCRAVVRSSNGGDSFENPVRPDPVLVEPECDATMINGWPDGSDDGGTVTAGPVFHANPGRGTDTESKSPPDGRAAGTVRVSLDGGVSWRASVVLNGNNAYSYSTLARAPRRGFVALAWETVLPGSGVPAAWSANNVVLTLVPQNFSAWPSPPPPPPSPAYGVTLERQLSKTPCRPGIDFAGFDNFNGSMWVANGCRAVFRCGNISGVQCYPCPQRPTVCPPRRQCDRERCAVCACTAGPAHT